jgi:hypothetical protein
MSDEIVNKVANSKLITISPEDYYTEGKRMELDIAAWLYEGLMLREKDFRQYVKEHNWEQYQDAYVSVSCSADAIVPQWAFMLLGAELQPYAKRVFFGSQEQLESMLFEETLQQTDFSEFSDKMLIIKGCGDKPIPPHAYLSMVSHLKPYVKSLMFGEACSTVPIYKKKA